jgi:Flp pilus assembly protein TadG
VSSRTLSVLRALAASTSGVAATEFALALPFLLTGSLMGLELANQAITQMQVSQLAA